MVTCYLRLIGASLAAQMQYRANLVFGVVADLLLNVTDFNALWALFGSVGALSGWSLREAALLYGFVGTSFALAHLTGQGIDAFNHHLIQGSFDRMLLRPRPLLLQLMAAQWRLRNLGRLAQAGGILAWGLAGAPPLSVPDLGLVAAALASGVLLFYGLFLLQAAASFWTLQGLEAFNLLTYGGSTFAQYPLEVYRPWLRNLFLYVIPVGAVGWMPARVLLERGAPGPAWAALLGGPALLAAGLLAWRAGVRRHVSTGS